MEPLLFFIITFLVESSTANPVLKPIIAVTRLDDDSSLIEPVFRNQYKLCLLPPPFNPIDAGKNTELWGDFNSK